jgi:peptidoglycan/LPS O-acetylase OafA/YrhL
MLYVPAFCSLLILLNLIEFRYGSDAVRRLGWLGRTSYGNYLIHSPLQMLFLIFVSFGLVDLEHVMQWYFMVMYISVVIMVSLLSFKYIERPIQKKVLNRF